jgi:hypothetical protein
MPSQELVPLGLNGGERESLEESTGERVGVVALAHDNHRTMPQLDEFVELPTSMPGNGGKGEPGP